VKQSAAVPPELDGAGLRFGLVAARFNASVTERLADGARRALEIHGVAKSHITQLWVPGAFEVPVVLERLARSGSVDGLVAIACIVRGETPHFDIVAAACAAGCEAVARRHGVPVGFGVLTTDDWPQAEARAGGIHGNKGEDAALAALETALVLREL